MFFNCVAESVTNDEFDNSLNNEWLEWNKNFTKDEKHDSKKRLKFYLLYINMHLCNFVY